MNHKQSPSKLLIFIVCFLANSYANSQTIEELHVNMDKLINEEKFKDAILIAEKLNDSSKIEDGAISPSCASYTYLIGNLYNELNNDSEAELNYLKAYEIQTQLIEENEDSELTNIFFKYYDPILNSLSELYFKNSNFGKAEKYSTKLVFIRSKLDSNSVEYVNSLNNLSICKYHLNDYLSAEKNYLESIKICNKNGKVYDKNIITSFFGIANIYFKLNDYANAENFFLKAVDKVKLTYGTGGKNYANALENLGLFYSSKNDFQKANVFLLEALNLKSKIFGEESLEYNSTLSTLAKNYIQNGDYLNAELSLQKAINIQLNLSGNKTADYEILLNNAAYLYHNLGLYKKAENLYVEALEISKFLYGTSSKDYDITLSNLGLLYLTQKKYSKASEYLNKSLEIKKNIFGKNKLEYGEGLNNLATLYFEVDSLKRALDLQIDAVNIFKNYYSPTDLPYITGLNNLAIYYRNNSYTDKARDIYLELLKSTQNNKTYNHINFIISDNLAFLYSNNSDFKAATSLFQNNFTFIEKYIKQNFPFLSEQEKNFFLRTLDVNFENFNSFLFKYYSAIPELSSISYNNELQNKELILRNINQIKTALQKSGDTALIKKWERLSDFKRQLAKIYSLPKKEYPNNFKELEDKAEQLDKEIARKSQEYQQLQQQNVSWQTIQKKLELKEAAIEFISFKYFSNRWSDSVFYGALILRPNNERPKFIPLFEQKQLDSLLKRNSGTTDSSYINQLYGTDNYKLYNLIVQPLDSLLRGVNTIYAAASGLLHTINLPLIIANKPDGKKFNVHLVGSTGELPQYTSLQLNTTTIQNAFVFGGINYENGSNTSISFKSSTYTPGFEQMASVATRGGINSWGYLPGTLTEATQIEKLNNKAGVKATVLSGTNASETNFKNLNGIQNPFILHLATHGYFFPNAAKEKPKDLNFFSSDKRTIFKWSDDQLLRSGLILAGGNKTWKNAIPSNDSTEDGILTSMEVANVDLSNCKLAVLSACETGLGDINGSEGVFGLQRGFKLAGVKNIIMSLWEIPDTQSAELLTLFYENCFSGLTVHESLKKAQLAMSKKYPVFYWAGFVLLE